MVLIIELYKKIVTSALFYCYIKKAVFQTCFNQLSLRCRQGLTFRLRLEKKERAKGQFATKS
jgi:hypothetical protein